MAFLHHIQGGHDEDSGQDGQPGDYGKGGDGKKQYPLLTKLCV